MDYGDIGQQYTEERNEALIASQRALAQQTLEITGTCHNPRCEDDCGPKPFCDAKCRDEYDNLKKRRS